MQTVWRLFSVVFLAAVVALTALAFIRNDFIYIFTEAEVLPADMPRTEVRKLPAYGEDPALTLWVTQPEEGQPIILYFMGEAGSLSIHEPRLRSLAQAGFGIVAMAYRGGGGQTGKPSERTLYRDALRVFAGMERIFDRPVKDTERVIYGYGLGTGLAARLAEEQEELAVILEAPFTRLCDVVSSFFRVLPGCLLLRGEEFNTVERIEKIGAPLLILQGNRDETVPLEMAQAVFDAAVQPKFMEVYQGGDHDNLGRYGAGRDAVRFIRTLRGER